LDYDESREYILSHPESWEDYPFGPGIAVFKVLGKMFATLGIEDGVARMNLKCDPDEAVMLRDIFEAVLPGYHMNKRHWNTVLLNDSVPKGEIERMIDNSYGLVVQGLPSKSRKALQMRTGQEIN